MSDDAIPFGFSTRDEYDRWLADMRAAKQDLRELADKAGRARTAELAGEAFDLAEPFVPSAALDSIKRALGAALFYAPTLRLLPFDKGAVGQWEKEALEHVLEALELLGRVLDVKGR